MSDLYTTFVTFSAIDFKGENVLSSYSLEQTPFLFVPNLPSDLNNVLWTFSDGTISKNLCASKYFSFPGEYRVNLIVYGCDGVSEVSSFSQVVTIHDFLPLTFSLSLPDYDNLNLQIGQITGPYTVNGSFPIYQQPLDIYYKITGSGSSNYFSISSNKFSHLQNFYSVFQQTYNYSLSSYQFQEIPQIKLDTIPLYAKKTSTGLVYVDSSDSDSFYVGLSGSKNIYLKDDVIVDRILIDMFFDRTDLYYPKTNNNVNFLNNLSVQLTASVGGNGFHDRLSITSNGIDGEGVTVTSFDIYPTKYERVQIPFVIKIKDSYNFSIKNFSIFELSDFSNVDVLSGGGAGYVSPYYYTLSSLNYTLSSQDHGGSFRGYIYFDNLPDNLYDVNIYADGGFIDSESVGVALMGNSAFFDVYKRDYYKLAKINEDFDAVETLKDLRFQESMQDKNVLFDEFLGTIFGSVSAGYESMGVKTYEKIRNFVLNNADPDVDEVYALLSQLTMMDSSINIYESSFLNYPEKIKRLINLISVSKNRLLGIPNKFAENFDIKGHVSKEEFGRNLGNELDTLTYVITAGTPIVALEKFSGEYALLNTYQPLSSSLVPSSSYPLSTYSSDWGWPLVLPGNFTTIDFPKYYLFYEYAEGADNTISDGLIDFANPYTTVLSSVSYTELNETAGIFENMLSNALTYTLIGNLSA